MAHTGTCCPHTSLAKRHAREVHLAVDKLGEVKHHGKLGGMARLYAIVSNQAWQKVRRCRTRLRHLVDTTARTRLSQIEGRPNLEVQRISTTHQNKQLDTESVKPCKGARNAYQHRDSLAEDAGIMVRVVKAVAVVHGTQRGALGVEEQAAHNVDKLQRSTSQRTQRHRIQSLSLR